MTTPVARSRENEYVPILARQYGRSTGGESSKDIPMPRLTCRKES